MTQITETSQDEKTMALVAYVTGIFTTFLGPLIVWLVKKDQSRFVAYHALQALIFNAVVFVAYAIGAVLSIVGIGLIINAVVGIAHIVFMIIAAMAASRGEWYELPVISKYARQAAGV